MGHLQFYVSDAVSHRQWVYRDIRSVVRGLTENGLSSVDDDVHSTLVTIFQRRALSPL